MGSNEAILAVESDAFKIGLSSKMWNSTSVSRRFFFRLDAEVSSKYESRRGTLKKLVYAWMYFMTFSSLRRRKLGLWNSYISSMSSGHSLSSLSSISVSLIYFSAIRRFFPFSVCVVDSAVVSSCSSLMMSWMIRSNASRSFR